MSDTLTVSEAATVAGVSVRTMRRWASSGQVRTIGQGHGRRIVAASISKDAATVDTRGHEQRSDSPTDAATTASETASGHEADRLADLVRELSARLADQTALTAIWQERARVLGDQLALRAPERPVQPDPEPAVSAVTPEPSGPWWRRVGRWLAS